jgi:hypothetical protein
MVQCCDDRDGGRRRMGFISIFQKRLQLEEYLKRREKLNAESGSSQDVGHRLILEISVALQPTEAYVLQAAFNDKNIARHVRRDPDTNVGRWLYLEYTGPEDINESVFRRGEGCGHGTRRLCA